MHLILAEPLGMHLGDGDWRLYMLPVVLEARTCSSCHGKRLMMRGNGHQFIDVAFKLWRPRKLGQIILTNFLLPRAFQRIIMLAGAAACRSLGKEKIVGRSMSFCSLRTTFLYPNRRVAWIRSWLLPWAWAPYAEVLKPRRKTWFQWCPRPPRPFPTPARMRECSVSMCMCVKIEIGLRRCGPVVLGKENDMIPNVSGAGYCNVLSWSLFSESRRALA